MMTTTTTITTVPQDLFGSPVQRRVIRDPAGVPVYVLYEEVAAPPPPPAPRPGGSARRPRAPGPFGGASLVANMAPDADP
jgi:hypothetical protein